MDKQQSLLLHLIQNPFTKLCHALLGDFQSTEGDDKSTVYNLTEEKLNFIEDNICWPLGLWDEGNTMTWVRFIWGEYLNNQRQNPSVIEILGKWSQFSTPFHASSPLHCDCASPSKRKNLFPQSLNLDCPRLLHSVKCSRSDIVWGPSLGSRKPCTLCLFLWKVATVWTSSGQPAEE